MYRNMPIADFCRTGSGTTPARANPSYYQQGTIPWVKSGELRENVIYDTEEKVTARALQETSLKLVPAGAILVALYGATVGRSAILGIEATTNQAVCHIVPDHSVANTKYLFHCLQHKVPELIDRAVGGAQPNISQATVRKLQIPLPPLDEQKRIAAVLDAADALRAKRRAALAKLDTLLQSVFLEMFGDPVTNPMGWEVRNLNDLASVNDRICYGVVQPGSHVQDGVPLIRVGDFSEGTIATSDLKRISDAIESDYRRSRITGNEILIACVGSIGTVALVDERMRGFNIARAVARIPLDSSFSRDYVASYLKTPYVQSYFRQETRTVSQPTLNIKQIKQTEVMLPPEKEQRRFESIADSIRQRRRAYVSSAEQLDLLQASIQQCAFSGRRMK